MIAREVDGTLVVEHDSGRLPKVLFAVSAVTGAIFAIELAFADARNASMLVVAAASTVSGWLLDQHSRFTFDSARRMVSWQSRWAWRHRTGTIPFGSVKHVLAESPVGDDGIPSRRVALHLESGEKLPLTVGFLVDPQDDVLKLASRIRHVLNVGGQPIVSEAMALVRAGRKLEAVRLLRQTEGISLEQATRQVEDMESEG